MSSNALTQVDVFQQDMSAMVTMIVEICQMNATAVSIIFSSILVVISST